MADYRRRLPHWQPDGQALFLTWHLHGSLPRALYPPPEKRNSGKAFVWMDRYLDTVRTGPHFLRRPDIANLVVGALRWADDVREAYRLDSFVVMSNHVHMLVDPVLPPPKFMQLIKGYTAREANRLLNRAGQPFRQGETYDRWVRNEQERLRIVSYIHQNPVQAGLVERPEQYRWSSAWQGP